MNLLQDLRLDAKRYGISRVSVITGLDYFGIPTAVAARPESKTLTVSQGKGLTEEASQISAIMEARELWASERAIENCSPRTTSADNQFVAWGPDCGCPLTEGEILATRDTVLIPACRLVMDWTSSRYSCPEANPSSAGLGAGVTVKDATEHALLELIERQLLHDKRKRRLFLRRRIATINDVGTALVRGALSKVEASGGSLFMELTEVASGYYLAEVHIWTPDLASFDSVGTACARTVNSALVAASLEAFQSRLTTISGMRDDITPSLFNEWTHRQPTHSFPLNCAPEKHTPLHGGELLEIAEWLLGGSIARVVLDRAGHSTVVRCMLKTNPVFMKE